MNILIGCEESGIVREAFRKRGHNAVSCDLLPSRIKSLYHFEGDIFKAIKFFPWDMAIIFPPCDFLSSSGMHWTTRGLRDAKLTEDAIKFFIALYDCEIPKIALENPIGVLSTRFRKPDQIIQPYNFGHDASKSTCLWLKGFPRLMATKYVKPRLVTINGKIYKRWSNQTDSGQNKLAPGENRKRDRAETYQGIADAMAMQWG